MDSTTEPPNPPHHTNSPEANSTRPNPFDDSDVASRKRRRTSLSGSPARSLGGSHSPRDEPTSITPPNADDDTSDNAMNIDNQPTAPKTPERRSNSRRSTPNPPSSKVTINLRNNNPDGNVDSPSPSVPTGSLESNATAQQEATSFEPRVVVDSLPTASQSSRSTSSLSSGSPPVELVTVPDTDNEDDILVVDPIDGVQAVGREQNVLDPTENFPYHEAHEHRSDTVQRLVHYISQSMSALPISPIPS